MLARPALVAYLATASEAEFLVPGQLRLSVLVYGAPRSARRPPPLPVLAHRHTSRQSSDRGGSPASQAALARPESERSACGK
jgi:hypothetical protein